MHTRNKSTITTNEIKKVVVPVPGHVHVRYLYRRNTHLWTLYVCTHEIFFFENMEDANFECEEAEEEKEGTVFATFDKA